MGKTAFFAVVHRWFERSEAIGRRFFDLNCKFSHLIIHVLPSPTRAERWRSELIVLDSGNFFFFLSTFKVFSSLFSSLNQLVKNTIDSVAFSSGSSSKIFAQKRSLQHLSTRSTTMMADGVNSLLLAKVIIDILLLWKLVPR